MRELIVVRAGLQSTVQDGGRFGHRDSGVAVAGALDAVAYAVANRLAGNDDNAAAIEITAGNAAFQFLQPTRFAVAGAECDARIDDEPVAAWSAHAAPGGATLALHFPRSGMRTVLAVEGGIDVPVILGSRSTDLAAAFGGFEGRALRNGDRLAIGRASDAPALRGRCAPPSGDMHMVRAVPGSEYERFTSEARERFFQSEWYVTPQSNRMGYRLSGPVLDFEVDDAGLMLSHAVFPGVVQVPPSGEPIVLLSDAQTTGGYAKIAVAIEADLWKLAQAPLGSTIRFARTTIEAARSARRELERYMADVCNTSI
ncbi:MAG TPA: biotin-dependent carboxyltransferase family protein [Candidatus Baltobacteraceae bacterium]|nr:biotin-dependent carboxyltransferase family protein [Candidatus Baltobacteraceae bacterium]